jgi:hypothetical protein
MQFGLPLDHRFKSILFIVIIAYFARLFKKLELMSSIDTIFHGYGVHRQLDHWHHLRSEMRRIKAVQAGRPIGHLPPR